MGKYNFIRITRDTILIENDRGKREKWSIETLQFITASTALPEYLREMAREALAEFGLLKEKKEPELIPSDTITTIDGIKVYMDLLSRAFFAWFKGVPLFGSLSDLERKIKGK